MEHDVAVIGLGSMGSAIVKALCARNLRVAVWNRSAGRAEPLAILGATPMQTPAEVLAAAPATLICLSDQAATAEVLDTAGQLDGRTLVQLSTVTSADALAFSDSARSLGAQALVGQIICFPDDVATGNGAAIASGAEKTMKQAHDILLAAFPGLTIVGQTPGAAAAFDKANLSFTLGVYLAFLQSAAICDGAGVERRKWFDFTLDFLSGPMLPDQLAILANQATTRRYEEGLDATLDVWAQAFASVLAESEASGASSGHLAPLATAFRDAQSLGLGEKEIGAIFESLRPGSG